MRMTEQCPRGAWSSSLLVSALIPLLQRGPRWGDWKGCSSDSSVNCHPPPPPPPQHTQGGLPGQGSSPKLPQEPRATRHPCALGPMDPLRRSPSPCTSRPPSPRTPPCEMLGHVGIEAVLEQLKIKAMKMGFEFNIMVVVIAVIWLLIGQSGLGKSTMVNTLFKSKMWKSTLPGLGVPMPQTLQLQSVTHIIEENSVKLKLTVTDTPGFGDQINNDKCWDPILGYINGQYERYLQEEILITRQRHIPDTRVHCCVYFVPPTGHCLRPLDIEFLQRLCRTVNVVPVIARADSLTIEEREAFRRRIQHDLRAHCIEVYPQKCFDEDISDRILNSKIRDRIPFAVVGADQEHLVNGRCVLGRKTKWGIIEVENMAHCEFPLLRDLLIRSHLQDLKDITHNVHYENYRVFRLNQSHALPRGPGWVNLAPAPADLTATPGPWKVRWQAHDSSDEEC
nr:septin-12 isoform X3 [Equus caballus]